MVASWAIVPLLSSEEVPKYIRNLVSQIPDEEKMFKHNFLHGVLLQIQQLLEGHLRSETNETLKSQIVNAFESNIATREALIHSRKCMPLKKILYQITETFVSKGKRIFFFFFPIPNF